MTDTTRQFWVIGGEFRDTSFSEIVDGEVEHVQVGHGGSLAPAPGGLPCRANGNVFQFLS